MARRPTLMVGHSAKLMQIQRQVILEDQLYSRQDVYDTPREPQELQMATRESVMNEEEKAPFLESGDYNDSLNDQQDVGFIGKLGDVYLQNQLCQMGFERSGVELLFQQETNIDNAD